MKAIEAYENFKSMNDQRSKSLSALFLHTERVSYCSGFTTTDALFLPRNIMAIVLSENIWLFAQLKQQKAHKVERGNKPFILIKGERMRLTFLASARLWEDDIWRQHFMAFSPSALGYAYKPKTQVLTSIVSYKDSNVQMPETLTFILQHTLSSSVCSSANMAVQLASEYHCRPWKQKETTNHCRLHQHKSLTQSTASKPLSSNRESNRAYSLTCTT